MIAPRIGAKLVASITRDDVEDVRDALDRAVAARKKDGGRAGLSGARARNVSSVLTSMMKEACTSKRRDMRVRADNPCATVQPPDRTGAKSKTFVYPSEFLKLVRCAAVPREWRELYAVACYLYLRPGELRALLWTDVDFQAGVVHVTKAYDEDSKSVKTPKTRNGVRDVPIPAALVLLSLKVMHERRGGVAEVLPIMQGLNENRRAGWMRKHFELAKLDRPRLTEESATTMQVNFRSWRDTGITWLALAGIDVAKMQRRAGHDAISTTLGYVKMAEDLTGSIGEPFPALPPVFLKSEGSTRVVAEAIGPVGPGIGPTRLWKIQDIEITKHFVGGQGRDWKTSEKDATPTIPRDSRGADPPTLDRDDAKGAPNPANPRRVDTGVDTPISLDLARAVVLATALRPFVANGCHPRRDLIALLKAAQPGGEVVDLAVRRRGPANRTDPRGYLHSSEEIRTPRAAI